VDLEQWLKDRCRAAAKDEAFELGEAFYRVVLPE